MMTNLALEAATVQFPQDARSYRLIEPAIRSEFDIFRTGTTRYY